MNPDAVSSENENELVETSDVRTVGSNQFIIDEVLRRLGTPRALYRVTATNLWNNHYRVNVYCQGDSSRAIRPVVMTDSFFVDVTDDGIVADPPIVHRYGAGRLSSTAV